MVRPFMAAAFGASLLGGCVEPTLSDDRIARSTADLLGLEPGSVTIDRRSDRGLTTEYLARMRDGSTATCSVNASDPTSEPYRIAAAEAPPGASPDTINLRGRMDRESGFALIGASRSGAFTCR